MNIERMNHLITVLEGVIASNKAFNLSGWAQHKKLGDDDIATHFNTVGDLKETCGTACCALGYAALDPVFVNQGLRLHIEVYNEKSGDWSGVYPESIEAFNKVMRRRNVDFGDVDIVFNDESSSWAAAKFFGIETEAANQLFMPYRYPTDATPITPEMVIERIQQVIANDGAALELAE